MSYGKMRRHIQIAGSLKQLNQKSLPESFTRTFSVHFWEIVHAFENVHKGPFPRPWKSAIFGTVSICL